MLMMEMCVSVCPAPAVREFEGCVTVTMTTGTTASSGLLDMAARGRK